MYISFTRRNIRSECGESICISFGLLKVSNVFVSVETFWTFFLLYFVSVLFSSFEICQYFSNVFWELTKQTFLNIYRFRSSGLVNLTNQFSVEQNSRLFVFLNSCLSEEHLLQSGSGTWLKASALMSTNCRIQLTVSRSLAIFECQTEYYNKLHTEDPSRDLCQTLTNFVINPKSNSKARS